MKTNQLKITYQKTGDLVPYARNSRTHSEEQVGQIAASIREFGFTNPVLVDEENTIIAGHGRIMAAQKLGMVEVPTITLSGLTESQRKAYIIADNRLALNAGWDDEMLRLEISDLSESEFDLDLLGFGPSELSAMISGPPDDGIGAGEETFGDQYAVTVMCSGESQQRSIYERLTSEGLTCKVVCV
jgi:ParB-like chromosome segregation protein Spo0J